MALFLLERQNKIVEMVNAEGRVTVSALAKQFDVTEDCIRKDLKQLEGQGLLKKVYGGAVSVEAKTPQRNVGDRLTVNLEAKQLIANKAFDLIQPGESLFLDASSTNLELAKLLAGGNKPVSIVSNMMGILRAVAINPLITALGTGGTVSNELDGFVGAMAVRMLDPMRFDRAFIGALSVSLDNGELQTYIWDDAIIKELAARHATHTYLMADASKFDASGNYVYGNVSQFEALITDKPTDELRAQVEQLGSAVI